MQNRDGLIELLDIIIQPGQKTLGDIADYLIENGVIVLPCKVGDTVYLIKILPTMTGKGFREEVEETTIRDIYVSDTRNRHHHIKNVYATRVEAEKALKERE